MTEKRIFQDVGQSWGTFANGGKLIDKFPGGGTIQAARLRREGHKVIKSPRGKALSVAEVVD